MQSRRRPKFLNLFTLGSKMSVTAKVSIFHRISGILLFLAIPLFLFVLHQSLTSPDFYNALYAIGSSVFLKFTYVVIIFAFIYHMCAGIRFLFLDIDKGVDIKTAKLTARIVLLVSFILSVVLGVLIW